MIKGTIIGTDFFTKNNWLFLVQGEDNQIYKILGHKGYKENRLRDPVKKIDQDSLFDGDIIEFSFVEKNGERIINKFRKIYSKWH